MERMVPSTGVIHLDECAAKHGASSADIDDNYRFNENEDRMSVFKLTDDGDIERDEFGMKPRVSGAVEATQNVSTRLRIIKGEVFRNTTIGLASFDFIFEPSTSSRAIANHVADVVGGTPGVVSPQVQLQYANDGSGKLAIGWDAFYSADDQTTRVPIHEQLTVTNEFGGVA